MPAGRELGHTVSKETRDKIRASLSGRKVSEESKVKRSLALKAYYSIHKKAPTTDEVKEKIRKGLIGKMVREKHWNWKGGLSTNKGYIKEWSRGWRARNHDYVLEEKNKWSLKRRENEAGRKKPDSCEVCDSTQKKIVFDHDHATGKFRGWLCDKCNCTLGFARDNPKTLRALAEYLETRSVG